MAGKKNSRAQLQKVMEELDRELDAEFEDALQATLKAIHAQEQGNYVIGMDEDTDNLEYHVATRRTVLQVDLYALEGPNAGVKVVFKGSITLDNKDVLTAQPATRKEIHLFRNVLAEPIRVRLPGHDDRVEINPKTNPRGWIKNLSRWLKSHALWATNARIKGKKRTSRMSKVKNRSKTAKGGSDA